MKTQIRSATIEDLDWLIEQLKKFSSFYGTHFALFGDEEGSKRFVTNLITNHVVLLAEYDNEPLALMAGYLGPHIYNPQIKVLSEMFWWVREEARGTFRGAAACSRLKSAFEERAKTENCDWIILTLIENRSPLKETNIIKSGYHLHERSYLMEVC